MIIRPLEERKKEIIIKDIQEEKYLLLALAIVGGVLAITLYKARKE